MKLTEQDYKLINYLYHNSREPNTKIAKDCKLSREQVNYKLNKYLSEGLIKGFFPIFNYSKLGYNYLLVLFLKFDKFSNQKTFSKKLISEKHCLSHGIVYGKYDLYLNMAFKNEKEFNQYLSNLLGESTILDYLLVKPYFIELFPLKFFNKIEKTIPFIEDSSQEIKLDNLDKKILKILSNNFRTKLIDIAIRTNISPELSYHRLKKLQKEKVILGSRIQFNMGKFGYHFSEILLDLKNFSEESKNRLKQFARKSKHINSLIFSITKPNCIIQLFHKEESELKDTINELKEIFSEDIIDLDLMLITDEVGKINPLPFL